MSRSLLVTFVVLSSFTEAHKCRPITVSTTLITTTAAPTTTTAEATTSTTSTTISVCTATETPSILVKNGDFNGPLPSTEHWSLLHKDNSWLSVGGISNDWTHSLNFGTRSFTDDYIYQEIRRQLSNSQYRSGCHDARLACSFGEDGAFAGLGDKLQAADAVNGGTGFKRITATCQWTEEQLALGYARVLFNFWCTQNFGWIDNIKFDFKRHDPERR
ncbi:hypothetical protein BHE90_009792 [Fusarium euwallaceae]|uniref:Ecp2 effector protein domain-containing protein n=1 Tax=Fusarium euwallaceae TaxID=1147111 RepID=A0A430LJ57_9HYPO|nr:hypothetical protein BHE90_009792 [Fusarium euwallaceae]